MSDQREYAIEVHGSAAQPLGMPVADFLRDYWQKRPLLIRQAWQDFVAPLTPNDLAGLACEEESLARIVRYDRRRDRWHLETGPFEESRFASLPARDWTLLVQDVDRWDPDVAQLLDFVHFLPRWRIDDVMISYAVPGGSVGAHVDQYDVFLVQGLGLRNWAIDARERPPLAYRDDAPIKLLTQFDATHEWVLAPGDVLYLPPGVPHFGVAQTECLTLSIGMRAPSAGELLGSFANARADSLDEALRYKDPDLTASDQPDRIDTATVARVRQALEQALTASDAELSDWFGRMISGYRRAFVPAPRRVSIAQIEKRLAKGAALVQGAGMRLCHTEIDGKACVYGDGNALPASQAAVTALYEPVTWARWNDLASAQREELLEWVRRGWLDYR